jgi:hypothetical protein
MAEIIDGIETVEIVEIATVHATFVYVHEKMAG